MTFTDLYGGTRHVPGPLVPGGHCRSEASISIGVLPVVASFGESGALSGICRSTDGPRRAGKPKTLMKAPVRRGTAVGLSGS